MMSTSVVDRLRLGWIFSYDRLPERFRQVRGGSGNGKVILKGYYFLRGAVGIGIRRLVAEFLRLAWGSDCSRS